MRTFVFIDPDPRRPSPQYVRATHIDEAVATYHWRLCSENLTFGEEEYLLQYYIDDRISRRGHYDETVAVMNITVSPKGRQDAKIDGPIRDEDFNEVG